MTAPVTDSKTYFHVYYVTCDQKDVKLNPIAIRPVLRQGYIEWEDTGRGTSFKVKEIALGNFSSTTADPYPEEISLTTEDGWKVQLTDLTLETYNKYVQKKVVGKGSHKNSQEIQNFYLYSDFN